MRNTLTYLVVGLSFLPFISQQSPSTEETLYNTLHTDSITNVGLECLKKQTIVNEKKQDVVYNNIYSLRDSNTVNIVKISHDTIFQTKKEFAYIEKPIYKTIVKTIWVGHAYSIENNLQIDTFCVATN